MSVIAGPEGEWRRILSVLILSRLIVAILMTETQQRLKQGAGKAEKPSLD